MKTPLAATGLTLLALLACEGGDAAPSVEAIPREQARRLYIDHCAICHGIAGDGLGPRHRSLHMRPPDFRRAAWRREATRGGALAAIRDGRPGTDMPAWKTLTGSEIAGLADYVLSFQVQGAAGSGSIERTATPSD